MNLNRSYYIVFLLTLFFEVNMLHAQEMPFPKRESRAVWVTTLMNLDWPRTKARDASSRERQKEEFRTMLDRLQAININTILLQTRVRGTTIYPSAIEPWDECLTGTTSKDPGYDPLAFAIDECHKRGMELHAWIVTIPCFKVDQARRLGDKSVLKTHPELCKRHEGTWYLDPGMPGTADYLTAICKEIADRYDIDGLHFDYIRYPENAKNFPDQSTYKKYGFGQNKAQWRRDNITHCVRQIYKSIKARKPWIKISSSPIGKFADLQRYSSKGWNAFEAVYQDAQGWLNEGIHDMLFPMMYFDGDHFYPFALDWQENNQNRPVVPGLGIYFLSPNEKNWDFGVIQRELFFLRHIGSGGQAYFRTRFLLDNVKGIYDYLRRFYYPYPALTPVCPSADGTAPAPPTDLHIDLDQTTGYLRWTPTASRNGEPAVRYNVYAATSFPVETNRPENLVRTGLQNSEFAFNPIVYYTQGYHFAVTSIDCYGQESEAAQLSLPKSQPVTSGLKLKQNGKLLDLPEWDTDFLVFCDISDRILFTAPYARQLDISLIQRGFYRIKTLESNGQSRLIGYFFKQ